MSTMGWARAVDGGPPRPPDPQTQTGPGISARPCRISFKSFEGLVHRDCFARTRVDTDAALGAVVRTGEDGDVIEVGSVSIRVIHTPGHTPGGMCLYADPDLITGDTLFVGDSGRTDLPGGHRPTLGESNRRLMKLPDDTIVWPGHNYGPTPSSTLHWEKRNNVNAKEYGYFVKD